MKKLIVLLSLSASALAFSQATRFVYQVTMKPNANDKSDVKTELAYLDVTPEKSVFVSEKSVKRDSLMERMRATNNFSFNREQMDALRSNINYTIEKDLINQKTSHKQRIGRDVYTYEEDRTLEWKILPETMMIDQYKAQKASTTFAGRVWNAWFTMDIPFQDGPYKFSGLPGLVLKVEDEQGDYSFDLRESKKIEALASTQQRGTVIKLKRKDFEKQQDKFQKDPSSFFNGAMMGGGRPGGNRQPDPNRMREIENRIKEGITKNNNPIELPEKK